SPNFGERDGSGYPFALLTPYNPGAPSSRRLIVAKVGSSLRFSPALQAFSLQRCREGMFLFSYWDERSGAPSSRLVRRVGKYTLPSHSCRRQSWMPQLSGDKAVAKLGPLCHLADAHPACPGQTSPRLWHTH